MTTAPKPPAPNGSAASSISDPGSPLAYLSMNAGAAADATGTNNTLTIFVPADDTSLMMGKGDPSGFCMSTDHHAHLTASATTLSLGDDGGVGLTDGFSVETDKNWQAAVQGFSHVHVEGDKNETVGGPAKHVYEKTLKFESKTRNDKVEGNWTQETSDHFENKSKDRHEKVDEEWTADIGKLEWKVTKTAEMHSASDWKWHVGGEKHEFTIGATQEVLVGSETKVCLLNKNEAVIGGVVDLMVGGKMETTLAKKGEINLGPKSEMDIMKDEVKTLKSETSGLEKTVAGLEKLDIGTKLDTMQANLVTMDAQIVSLGIAIYK